MTFDEAQEKFRSNPTKATAADYQSNALIYWTDEMIGDDTFIAAVREIVAWLGDSGASFRTTRLLVIQRPNGKFFKEGYDSPDTWVSHPSDATDRAGFLRLSDARYGRTDNPIVEVEVSYRLTGKKTADLYSGGELIDDQDKPWTVRITRSDGEYADVPVWAQTFEKAKEKALKMVKQQPGDWFDDPEPPTFHVGDMDDDEDMAAGHAS